MTSFDSNPKLDSLLKQGLKKSAPANFTDKVMQHVATQSKPQAVSSGFDYSKLILIVALVVAVVMYAQQLQFVELPAISGQFTGILTIVFSAVVLLIGLDKMLSRNRNWGY